MPSAQPVARVRGRRLALLLALYFAEGLPFGFQATALPAYLRTLGVSLASIGYAGALSLPWVLKPLWAPLIDRHRRGPLGARKSWILPLQVLLALTCFAAASLDQTSIGSLLALVFLMNLFAATADIAIDALAIDLLSPEELGAGNAAQVVGYKLGMLTAGGLLVAASANLGGATSLAIMGGLVLAVAAATALHPEDRPSRPAAGPARARLMELLGRLRALLVEPPTWSLVALVSSYKVGETMIDTMLKPYLVDHGFTIDRIGLWIGTYGMAASVLGSLLGGWLAGRVPVLRVLALAAVLRVLPMFALVVMTLDVPRAGGVVAYTVAEHFFAGALTTATFAFMMSRVDREIGATHYALLASLEVVGKSAGGLLSGRLAEDHGYAGVFVLGTAASLAFLGVLARVARDLDRPAPAPSNG